MDIFETIRRPWKEPVAYTELVFWFVIFIIAAVFMYDGMRIAGQWIKSTATS